MDNSLNSRNNLWNTCFFKKGEWKIKRIQFISQEEISINNTTKREEALRKLDDSKSREERARIYGEGYKQGRFDEYIERWEHELKLSDEISEEYYQVDKVLNQDLYSIYATRSSRYIAENLKKEDAELIVWALNTRIKS